MKGRQLVGSVEIEDGEELAPDEEDAGSRQKFREDEDDGQVNAGASDNSSDHGSGSVDSA